MKLIKLAFLSIVFLFLVVFVISLFIPSHVRISRAVNMRSSTDAVFNEIDDLNKWKQWYPGFDTSTIEPILQKDGRLVTGKFSTTTIAITQRAEAEINATFTTGTTNPVISGWQAVSYNNSDSLTLQWYLDFKLKWYPWEKFFSLAYDKMYGTQMEDGLRNLKKNVER